jgi:hypothetical protein
MSTPRTRTTTRSASGGWIGKSHVSITLLHLALLLAAEAKPKLLSNTDYTAFGVLGTVSKRAFATGGYHFCFVYTAFT